MGKKTPPMSPTRRAAIDRSKARKRIKELVSAREFYIDHYSGWGKFSKKNVDGVQEAINHATTAAQR